MFKTKEYSIAGKECVKPEITVVIHERIQGGSYVRQ